MTKVRAALSTVDEIEIVDLSNIGDSGPYGVIKAPQGFDLKTKLDELASGTSELVDWSFAESRE